MNRKKLVCVDLFAGAGGFSLAAANVGLSIVAAVEKNGNACATYRRNILRTMGNETELYAGDILELSPESLSRAHFTENIGCDMVLGDPPCQGFSVHRIKDAGVGDPRNALILRYFEYVATLRPKVFLMENVPGILWPRHKDFLDAFYKLGGGLAMTFDHRLFWMLGILVFHNVESGYSFSAYARIFHSWHLGHQSQRMATSERGTWIQRYSHGSRRHQYLTSPPLRMTKTIYT